MQSVIHRRITRTLALVILAGGLLSGCDSKLLGKKK
jgi:hypothetical protein